MQRTNARVGKTGEGKAVETEAIKAERLEGFLKNLTEAAEVGAFAQGFGGAADADVVSEDAAVNSSLVEKLAKLRKFDVMELLDTIEDTDGDNDEDSSEDFFTVEDRKAQETEGCGNGIESENRLTL
jgi:hypothetical protein